MIHQFEFDGKYFVLDINSGAVHMVDKLTYDLCAAVKPPLAEKYPLEIISAVDASSVIEMGEAYGELYQLFKNGLLYAEEEELDSSLIKPHDAPIKALCLHVSHDCNLRCKYCFAQTGDFGTVRSLMDVQTAKNAIDFVIAQSQGRRNIEIDFFGGEPLMAFDVVKETVEYAKQQAQIHDKNFRFTMTTNGVLLSDEVIEYCNSEMSNVVLSLDGRKQVNDKMRPTVSGEGSYDVVMPKFKKLVAQRSKDLDYYVRSTYTGENLDFMQDVLDLYKNGFDELSAEPVSAPEGCGYEIKQSDLPRIREEYRKLARKMAELRKKGKGFEFFHFNVDLDQGPCIIKRMRGCGAGCEYVAITPEGDVYPCHQFVGNQDFCMGNINKATFDKNKAAQFGDVSVYTRPACRDCWAKYYCSGGCSAANFHAHGDINQSYEIGCELEKMRLECAIYLAATSRR